MLDGGNHLCSNCDNDSIRTVMKKNKIEVSIMRDSNLDLQEFNKGTSSEYATGVLYHPLGLVEVYTEKNLLSLKTIVRGRLCVQYFNKNFTRMGIHTKASRFINEVVGMSESEPCPHIPKSFEEAIRKCVVKKPLVYWKYQLQKVSKRTGEVLAYKRYMNEGFLRRYGSAIRESYEGSGEVIYNSATKEWERFEVEVELFRWDRAKPEKVPHEEMLRLTTL